MIRKSDVSSALALPLFALALAAAAQPGWAEEHDEDAIPLSEAEVFFELNDTDGDLGIHSSIDGDAWKRLSIEDPNGRRMLNIRLAGRLLPQGLTQLFFESAEPTFDELDPEDFFARFPEGEYEIEGVTLEGEEIEGEAWLSHVLADRPRNVTLNGSMAAEDCDAILPGVSAPVVIRWDAVTAAHPELGADGPVEVVKYQLVVEREEPELLILSVDLPPTVTEFEIPEAFTDLDSGDGFKFEILVRTDTGNQTAVESCFELN